MSRIAAVLLLFAPLFAFAGEAAAPQISLLTFGPGQLYWERFGHNAILVRAAGDGEAGPDATNFNYGIFDFNQKNFFLNFARGYMQYRLAAYPLAYDLHTYSREGRWVVEQQLQLSPGQRLALRDFLEWNAQPQNAQYRYDYFVANCSTRVRDALDRALGGALRRQLERQRVPSSYRFDAVRLIWPDLWLGLGMDLALGPSADRPLNLWQQSFVPMVLMDALHGVRVAAADGSEVPLVGSERQLLAGALPDPPAAPPDVRLQFLALGLLLGGVLLLLAQLHAHRAARWSFALLAVSFSLISGLAGLILAAMWGLTEHWAGWRNENLLLLDPLQLLLIPAWIGAARTSGQPALWARRLSTAIAALALLSLLVRLLPGFQQMNLHWIFLLLPAHCVLAFVVRRFAKPVAAHAAPANSHVGGA
jgi:hypothetical protein